MSHWLGERYVSLVRGEVFSLVRAEVCLIG